MGDLARNVYGVLGIPIDSIDTTEVIRRIDSAVTNAAPFLISTPNLNFLISSQTDEEFRTSVLLSDLCTADGIPIVWLARLLGLPIRERVAGSDLFDALKFGKSSIHLKVFFFGGPEGVAATVCEKLNAESCAMTCVGTFYPGYCSVDEMSTDAIIDNINSSGADLLAVALSATKGQAWLNKNHDRLQVPVRIQLGATVNFQAGTVKRAPLFIRKCGFEWLWRIKEEPQLWRRYWTDGLGLLKLVLTRVLPIIIMAIWQRLSLGEHQQDLLIEPREDHKYVFLSLDGPATAQQVAKALPCFQNALATEKNISINFANTRLIDSRFLGLLLMLNKVLKRRQLSLNLEAIPPRIEKTFRLNGFGFLLRA